MLRFANFPVAILGSGSRRITIRMGTLKRPTSCAIEIPDPLSRKARSVAGDNHRSQYFAKAIMWHAEVHRPIDSVALVERILCSLSSPASAPSTGPVLTIVLPRSRLSLPATQPSEHHEGHLRACSSESISHRASRTGPGAEQSRRDHVRLAHQDRIGRMVDPRRLDANPSPSNPCPQTRLSRSGSLNNDSKSKIPQASEVCMSASPFRKLPLRYRATMHLQAVLRIKLTFVATRR